MFRFGFVFVFFSLSCMPCFALSINYDDLSVEELKAKRDLLIEKTKKTEKIIQANGKCISDLLTLEVDSCEVNKDSSELDFADYSIALSGNTTNPDNQLQATLSEVISVASAIITAIGPTCEFFHNWYEFGYKRRILRATALGWPIADFTSNAAYVTHLCIDYFDGEDSDLKTFTSNIIPSSVMMFIDALIVISYYILWTRQRIVNEYTPLINSIN